MPQDSVIRISVTGPESTGKSTLSQELAQYFGGVVVSEYARTYLEKLGRHYIAEDLPVIARMQREAWDRAARDACRNGKNLLVCDTDMLVMRIWSLHAFGKCDPYIEHAFRNDSWDFVLLCDVDLPWTYDPLREHPHLRSFFFDWYRRELEDAGRPFAIVRGQGSERLNAALKALGHIESLSPSVS